MGVILDIHEVIAYAEATVSLQRRILNIYAGFAIIVVQAAAGSIEGIWADI